MANLQANEKDLTWEWVVDVEMQDDDDACRNAVLAVFGGDTANPDICIADCAEHFWRNLRKKIWMEDSTGKFKGHADAMRKDFEFVKAAPTKMLKNWACKLYIERWTEKGQSIAATYFKDHCDKYRWTRSDMGAGMDVTNNGLEGSNRVQKVDIGWARLSITNIGPWMVHWLRNESKRDYCFGGSMHDSVVSITGFAYAQELIKSDWFSMCNVLTGNIYILPLNKLLREENLEDSDAKTIKAGLQAWRKDFKMLMGPWPKVPSTFKPDKEGAEFSFNDLREWVHESFVMLCPLETWSKTCKWHHAHEALETEIWDALNVSTGKRAIHKLMACTCKHYMHYLFCWHTLAFHVWKGQVSASAVNRSSQAKTVECVNKSQKITAGPGRPSASVSKIKPGSALSKD